MKTLCAEVSPDLPNLWRSETAKAILCYMTSQARKILQEALKLPKKDRLYLVEALQDSVEPVESQKEVDAAWRKEIVRRVKSIKDGTAVLLDGDEVVRELKSKYGL
jgi:putative addiction module component (TIGR02574 family)